MAERGTPRPKPEAPIPNLSTMPVEALRARTMAFLRMTQGPDKPTGYATLTEPARRS